MIKERGNKCKYCDAKLPLSYEAIATEGKGVACPGCGTRYTPVVFAGVMGTGVEVWDDGPPEGENG